ncbi:ABC transporter substrate-binding protein [Arthrobacter sp. H5]|uniref:transporter substrate-binding domain-containing protein n=1 Tax=Arthrobacter sp. H5 TaxID=1267973 RepID=UPI00048355EC|nr:ABC transporter substrate-binding protein [Arthrobacter sp. H5]
MPKLRFPLAGLALVLLTGCGMAIPADPDGTLNEVTDGILHVGVTASGEWVELRPGGDPQGVEPALVQDFAKTLDAEIEWVQGSERELAEGLKLGELDLAVGGFADDTPWVTDAGMTLPYAETTDQRGNTIKHVMLTPLGENAFLLNLERFLLEQEVAP